MLAGVTPLITVAPGQPGRYPWCDCTLRTAGMPGPWSLLMPASRQAVSRALGLLERQGPAPPGRAPGLDVNVLRLWIRASADPIGSRNQPLSELGKIAGS